MLGVGILGAGFFGAVHARAIATIDGLRVAAVCADEAGPAQSFAAEHGGTPYHDWRRLLDDNSVDVVVIAAPHHLHAQMAIAAAAAGKHILLEKPMARTTAECTAIMAAAQRHGVKLMVGHLLHFACGALTARTVIDSGEIGRPVIGSSTLLKLWMEPNRRPWHLDPASGGGMLMTAGIHSLDLLVWLMDARVSAISAATGTFFHDQAADDSAMLLARFGDGRFGQVASVGYRDGAMTYGMELVCERGTLRIDLDHGVWLGRDARWILLPNSSEPDWMARAVEREWQAMRAAATDNAPVPVTGDYGRHIVACIEATLASSRARAEVAVAA